MARQRWRDYQPTNQEQFLALLDSPSSHNSVENEYHWRSICKCSNCIWRGPQTGDIDQPATFDFDPDAIQVMEDVEFEKLPEAVNREIIKNSEQIIFESGEEISPRNLIKLYGERSKTREQDRLIREVFIEKEEEAVLKSGQEMISEEVEKSNLEDIIRLNEKITEILNSSPNVPENEKQDFLERMMFKLNARNAAVLTNQETISHEREILERKLVRVDEGKSDIPKNSRHIEGEELALAKEDSKDIERQVRQSQQEFEKKYKIKSNEFARKDNEARLEKWHKRHQLITEFNRSLNDNFSATILSHKVDRLAFSDFGGNRIGRLVVPGQKNPKRDQESSKKFKSKSSIDNPSGESDQKKLFKTFEGQLIALNRDQRKRRSVSSEKRKCLKECNRSLSDNSVMADDTRPFREFRKNVKILEKDEKSPREIEKSLAKSLDRPKRNDNLTSRPRVNYDFFSREENDDHQMEQRDSNVAMENEKALREPLLIRPSNIAIRSKLYNTPVSDLSPESGFCEEGSESGCREPRPFTRRILKNVDILGRKSNLLQKNATDDVNDLQKCAANRVARESTHVDNGTLNINKSCVSPLVDLPCKNFVVDNKNSVRYSDDLSIGEQITCADYEIQAAGEVNKKYKRPNTLFRKLISNVDDLEETSFKKQFVSEQNSIQNIDKILARQKRGSLNVDAACKYFAEDIDCLKGFEDTIVFREQIHHNSDNAMRNERKAVDFSNNDITCENSVSDHPKRCNSAFAAKEQIVLYENNSISRENLANDVVDFDRSKQRDDAFVAVNIV